MIKNTNEFYEELIAVLNEKRYLESEIRRIKKAYQVADEMHKGQKRASGEDFIIHPLSVAIYLTRMNVDPEMIITGLLHDTVEDTSIDLEKISQLFSDQVALLVDGVTKITKLKSASKSERKAETIRKMLFTMILDMRVIIIKLADKIHNMSTIEHLPRDKQKKIAKETLQIYAPLAGKLGLTFIKNELENLALKTLKPNEYQMIVLYIKKNEKKRINLTEYLTRKLKQKLEIKGINCTIKSRVKHHYSIYKKMQKYSKSLDTIFDLYGIRIISDTPENCYIILGLVHRLWQPVHGRFKDYIANPKSNGYKSLHTTVIVDRRKVIEIQIRTKAMDEMNEFGIAAHWYYKKGDKPIDQDIKWLKSLKKVQEQKLSPQEYYAAIRNDILKEEIYVFTPKNDIIEMPQGATPLDFAYRIHSEIGHRCRGAKANGSIIPLYSTLKNGMVVEIITAKEPCPKREWVSIARTTQAKRKIRHFFRGEANALSQPETIKKEPPDEKVKKYQKRPSRKARKKASQNKISIEIEGEKNLLFSFAKCCTPQPADLIVGFVSRGRGVIIHRQDCKNIKHIKDFETRKISVNWTSENKNNFYSFFIRAINSNNLFKQISNIINKHSGQVIEYHLEPSTLSNRKIDGYFSIELPNNKNIDIILKEIKKIPSILFIDNK